LKLGPQQQGAETSMGPLSAVSEEIE